MTEVIVAFALGLCVIALIASILLLRAVKKRDHFYMIPYLTLNLFVVLLCCYDFKNISEFEDVLKQTAVTMACAYVFVGIYSLYDVFRQERDDLNGQSMVQPTQAFVYIRTDRGDAFMPPSVNESQRVQLMDAQPPPYSQVVGAEAAAKAK